VSIIKVKRVIPKSMTDSVIREFVAKQRELLELELEASNLEEQDLLTSSSSSSRVKKTSSSADNEEDAQEERASHVLGNLEASEISVGMYGRTVVELTLWSQAAIHVAAGNTSSPSPSTSADTTSHTAAPSSSSSSTSRPRLLPAHRFTVGDEVEIRSKHATGNNNNSKKKKSNNAAVGGVISAVTDTSISIALFQDRHSRSTNKHNQGTINTNNSQSNNNTNNSNHHDERDNEESDILNMAPLTLLPKSSIEVHKKLMAALDKLERYGIDHPIAGPVVQAMFGLDLDNNHPADSHGSKHQPTHMQKQQTPPAPFNPNLDASQLEAIHFALQPERPVALIHGPPGTGKTTTIAELIQQAVHHHNMRVLVTAPSNVAVDNILERLVAASPEQVTQTTTSAKSRNGNKKKRLRTVRLGHPARIKSSTLTHSLEHLVQTAEGTEIVQDVRQELQSFLKILSNPKARGQDKRVAYQQIKSLRKEVRVREEKVVQELITTANVVLATTVGAGAGILDKFATASNTDGSDAAMTGGFDLVVIDEAAQALEASCWIPILRGRKVVLAGDHKQLPPTIKSKDRRVVAGLSNTMFERLMKLYSNNDDQQISRMLQIQYRMNHRIADWASQAMYKGELMTHETVRNRTLSQLPKVMERKITDDDDDLKDAVLVLVDTAGCDMHEMETAAGSRFNEGEARIVDQHIRKILRLGVEESQIAVITPYNGQVELLRSMLLPDFPKLEIRSVDGFQGGEREAVILSLVRSSERGGKNGIGFLRDDRRQNVAVTRAKRHLAIVCDTETVSKSPFIANLIAWMEKYGEYRSAIEYIAQSADDKGHEEDLRRAEADIMKLLESSGQTSNNNNKEKRVPSTASSNIASKRIDKELEASKRKALMDRISAFSESGKHGDEMILSSELSSYDRRLVHEFAEQLGLGHRSEGTEGVDRRITLVIQRKTPISVPAPIQEEVSMEVNSEKQEIVQGSKEDVPATSNFAALALDGSDSDEEEQDDKEQENDISLDPTSTVVPESNSLLGQLAKERAEREKQRAQMAESTTVPPTAKSQKKKKKKGQKLGGTGPTKKPVSKEPDQDDVDDVDNDMDDMAFLDAQIEKAQNAHGRKVAASGKQYKTIVNGILNSRPEPKSKPKNARASSSLQAKLREAESSRKKKKTPPNKK
jgi:predicted DNA helicase